MVDGFRARSLAPSQLHNCRLPTTAGWRRYYDPAEKQKRAHRLRNKSLFCRLVGVRGNCQVPAVKDDLRRVSAFHHSSKFGNRLDPRENTPGKNVAHGQIEVDQRGRSARRNLGKAVATQGDERTKTPGTYNQAPLRRVPRVRLECGARPNFRSLVCSDHLAVQKPRQKACRKLTTRNLQTKARPLRRQSMRTQRKRRLRTAAVAVPYHEINPSEATAALFDAAQHLHGGGEGILPISRFVAKTITSTVGKGAEACPRKMNSQDATRYMTKYPVKTRALHSASCRGAEPNARQKC